MKPNFLKKTKTAFISHALIYFIFCCLILLFIPGRADAKIVFEYNGSIFVMNDDGSSVRRLTDNKFWEDSPRWSPDGTQIVFERNLEKDIQKYQLFIMDADGTNQRQLTHHGEGDRNGDAAWSPDGRSLAFKSNRSGNLEIYVMDLASRETKQLTDGDGAYSPNWSPDGEEIVYGQFVRKPGLGHKNIWLMSADGTNQRPLLPDPDKNEPTLFRYAPLWFPDGQRILMHETGFDQERHPKRYVILSKKGRRIKEIFIDDEKMGGRWVGSGECLMDDGRSILFSAGRLDVPDKDRFHDIYRYEIKTRRLRRLTRHRYHDSQPDWIAGPLSVSPQGKLSIQWGEIKERYRKL